MKNFTIVNLLAVGLLVVAGIAYFSMGLSVENPVKKTEIYFGSAKALPGADEQYLKGTWRVLADRIENNGMPASIHYSFDAKKVFLVASADKPVKVEIFIDGIFKNTITVDELRSYEIYTDNVSGSHKVEIRPTAPGLKVFTLTFGN